MLIVHLKKNGSQIVLHDKFFGCQFQFFSDLKLVLLFSCHFLTVRQGNNQFKFKLKVKLDREVPVLDYLFKTPSQICFSARWNSWNKDDLGDGHLASLIQEL